MGKGHISMKKIQFGKLPFKLPSGKTGYIVFGGRRGDKTDEYEKIKQMALEMQENFQAAIDAGIPFEHLEHTINHTSRKHDMKRLRKKILKILGFILAMSIGYIAGCWIFG